MQDAAEQIREAGGQETGVGVLTFALGCRTVSI